MKKILLFTFIALPLLQFSQTEKQDIIVKYIITEGTKNNQDISTILTKAGAYTVFYTLGGDKTLYLANVWPNSNSQSYGPIHNVTSEKIEESDEYYETDIFYFDWQYANNYDGGSGLAKVEAATIHKPEGIFFVIEIITESLDKTIYKGYMEGTLKNNSLDENSSNTTTSRFRRDYTHVAFFDINTETWGEWEKGSNTFVLNYNDNFDIAHYKPSGDFVVYKNISNVEEDTTESGDAYQIITALDEDGLRFSFQIFYNPRIGVKFIYNDAIIQFANFDK